MIRQIIFRSAKTAQMICSQQLNAFIKSIKNEYLSTLLNKLFVEDEEFVKSFQEHSAAKTVHHGFIGGLMEHTLSVTRLCDYMAGAYPLLEQRPC